jgi:hypothetical protein
MMVAGAKTKGSNEVATEVSAKLSIYHVTRLEKTKLDNAGPIGYRYTIEGGYAPIAGFRTGSKEDVGAHATALAKEMNERRGLKGTKHIVIGKPRKSA